MFAEQNTLQKDAEASNWRHEVFFQNSLLFRGTVLRFSSYAGRFESNPKMGYFVC